MHSMFKLSLFIPNVVARISTLSVHLTRLKRCGALMHHGVFESCNQDIGNTYLNDLQEHYYEYCMREGGDYK